MVKFLTIKVQIGKSDRLKLFGKDNDGAKLIKNVHTAQNYPKQIMYVREEFT